MGIQPRNFSITFTGRQSQNIVVTWNHGGVILHDTAEHRLITTFSEETMTGTTSVNLPEMTRADGGTYRVVVNTDFGGEEIEGSLKRKVVSFQVEVRGEKTNVCLGG